MSEALFQFMLAGAVLLQLSAIIEDELTVGTSGKTLAAACLFAAAAMIRPTGVVLPLFASLPLVLMKTSKWQQSICLGLLAFAIPVAAILSWSTRNERVAGVNSLNSDSVQVLFYYNAAGVLAYADHLPFRTASTELAHEIGWRGDPLETPASFNQLMMRKSFQVFERNPFATVIVTVRGLLLVATVPDRNELNEMIGTNGGGPLGLPPSSNITERVERTLNSPMLASLVLIQVMLILTIWAGVFRALLHTDWTCKIEVSCILIPLMVAFAMLACAASPNAHARFRVPAMPFLAMLAGIGWLGQRRVCATMIDRHVRTEDQRPQIDII